MFKSLVILFLIESLLVTKRNIIYALCSLVFCLEQTCNHLALSTTPYSTTDTVSFLELVLNVFKSNPSKS